MANPPAFGGARRTTLYSKQGVTVRLLEDPASPEDFADMVERSRDFRAVFKSLVPLFDNPQNFTKPERYEGYREHWKTSGLKKRLRVRSTRPFGPEPTEALSQCIEDALTDYLINGTGG